MTPVAKSRRKSAVEKRDTAREPYVKVLTESKSKAFPVGKMLIASPLAVQRIVERVPVGRVIVVSALRDALAREFGAQYTCPITTGIFLRVAADAAEEERLAGATGTMPWWRVVRDDGGLMEKLPGGAVRQAKALGAEGFTIERVHAVPKRIKDFGSAGCGYAARVVKWSP
jgi:6-O-methylguanine DNA methyltransferase, DNA binding domain